MGLVKLAIATDNSNNNNNNQEQIMCMSASLYSCTPYFFFQGVKRQFVETISFFFVHFLCKQTHRIEKINNLLWITKKKSPPSPTKTIHFLLVQGHFPRHNHQKGPKGAHWEDFVSMVEGERREVRKWDCFLVWWLRMVVGLCWLWLNLKKFRNKLLTISQRKMDQNKEALWVVDHKWF